MPVVRCNVATRTVAIEGLIHEIKGPLDYAPWFTVCGIRERGPTGVRYGQWEIEYNKFPTCLQCIGHIGGRLPGERETP